MSLPEDVSSFITEQMMPTAHDAFAREFVASAAAQVLVASPVGTGRSRLAAVIVAAALRANFEARVLIVSPATALSEQFAARLRDLTPAPCVMLDRATWRVAQASEILRRGYIVIVTRAALVDDSIREALLDCLWDVVVIDEVNVPSKAAYLPFVETLLKQRTARRMLALTSTEATPKPLRDLERITWTLSDFPEFRRPVAVNHVTYSRTPEEERFWDRLEEMREANPAADHSFRTIRQRAFSSLYAAEVAVRRGQERWGADQPFPWHEADWNHTGEDAESDSPSDRLNISSDDATSLLSILESLGRDSKLDRLREIATSMLGDRLLLLSAYADTARYVAAALSELTSSVTLITSSSPVADHDQLMSTKGWVVATDEVIAGRGMVFPAVIHYDVPRRLSALALRTQTLQGGGDNALVILHREEIAHLEQLVAELIQPRGDSTAGR